MFKEMNKEQLLDVVYKFQVQIAKEKHRTQMKDNMVEEWFNEIEPLLNEIKVSNKVLKVIRIIKLSLQIADITFKYIKQWRELR